MDGPMGFGPGENFRNAQRREVHWVAQFALVFEESGERGTAW
jgi:hypothetical protein